MPERPLIIGASGLVGSALKERYPDAHTPSHAEVDVTDDASVNRAVSALEPELIFNCAVLGVDQSERDPRRAEAVNAVGAANVARAAAACGARLVHFSTNYVFDGARTSGQPYTQHDAPGPVNVYGRTKLAGEQRVVEVLPNASIIRTSWVFGPGKPNFLSTVAERLERGEHPRAISDVFASATWVHDLVERAALIAGMGTGGLWHVVNDGVLSYADFALEAARITGCDPLQVELSRASEAGWIARRPRWTPLRCLMTERSGFPPLRTWSEALRAFLGFSRQ